MSVDNQEGPVRESKDTGTRKPSANDLSILKKLCYSSIEAAVTRLSEVGSWPRPPRARRLRMGHDLFGDDLRGIQEMHKVIDFLASQERIKSIYLQDPKHKDVLERYWTCLLLNILTQTDGTSISRPVFHKWFSRFVNELYADTAVWRAIDTVKGLALVGKEYKLDEFTTLVSMTGDQLELMVQRHDNSFDAREFQSDEWNGGSWSDKVAVVTTMRIRKSEYIHWGWPTVPMATAFNETGRASAALGAIRLTKGGSPSLNCHGLFQISWFTPFAPLGYARLQSGRPPEKETTLDRKDQVAIRNIWRELMRRGYGQPWYLPPQGTVTRMDIAIGRFFRSYNVGNWLEELLELTIALEALLAPADNQELNNRIALRCAWLLGSDVTDQDKSHGSIYRRVKALYDIRSRTVHGDIPKENEVQKWVSNLSGVKYDRSRDWELKDLAVESARDIVRRSIRVCTRLSLLPVGGPHWPFPDDFDQYLPASSQQRQWQKAAGVRVLR